MYFYIVFTYAYAKCQVSVYRSSCSHYRFEIRQNSVKSTVRSEIDHFRCKLGVGGKLFSSFSYNQNCSEVSIDVIWL